MLTSRLEPKLLEAVHAVIAGADHTETAIRLSLDPHTLQEAVEIFETAGWAALDRQPEQGWYQVRVQFPQWDRAEIDAATHLLPALKNIAPGNWWFLRKHPHWRLRITGSNISAVTSTLDEMVSKEVIQGWWPSIYEPEVSAFGGPEGMNIAHSLFCADSHETLKYARLESPPLGRRELSLLLLNVLQRSAGLDWFEIADVFDRVARLRASVIKNEQPNGLANQVRVLLATDSSALFDQTAPAASARLWYQAFDAAGAQLASAAAKGALKRGLRAVLAHVIIFHWNRLGLSANVQAALARSAVKCVLN